MKARMVYQTDETRQRILDTARTLFTERGLFDTQMTDVAAQLGLSRTTLYRYYQDKLDLAFAILHILMREMFASWKDPGQAGGSGRDRLAAYLRDVWCDNGTNTAALRYFAEFDAFFSGSRIPEGFREKMETAIPPGDPFLLELIAEGQRDGSIRRELAPHLLMATVLNAVRGLQQRVALRGEVLVELNPMEAGALVEELLSYVLRGIAPEGVP